jgi:predicted metal-dependent hydrolase
VADGASIDPFPAPLRRFVALFGAGAFWESHEVLEDAWRELGSAFYQGLILVASAFVHVDRRNAHGVRAQCAKAAARLQDFRPHYLGVDVDALLAALTSAVAAVDAGRWPPPPTLVLDPRLIRGDEPERAALEPPPQGR